MKRGVAALASACVLTVALGVGSAWAGGKVTITREENKPKNVEIKSGDSVRIDARGWPLLIDAADRGDAEIVQALLGGGALVNGKTPTGVTALSAAVLNRHTGRGAVAARRGRGRARPRRGDANPVPRDWRAV